MCQNGIFYERADENALKDSFKEFEGVGLWHPCLKEFYCHSTENLTETDPRGLRQWRLQDFLLRWSLKNLNYIKSNKNITSYID